MIFSDDVVLEEVDYGAVEGARNIIGGLGIEGFFGS